jgi:predicted membrane-bound spermidine synthase
MSQLEPTDMNDKILHDSRQAAAIFTLSFLLLLASAALGMNSWPAQELASSLFKMSGKDLFLAFHGYALPLVVLFWGSRPPPREQWLTLILWPLLSAALWSLLSPSLPIAWMDASKFPAPMLLVVAMSIPATFFLSARAFRKLEAFTDPVFELRLRWLLVLSLLFMMVPHSALSLNATLHPYTLDMYALHWDVAAGLHGSPWLIGSVHSVPGLAKILDMAYGMTPLSFLSVAILHLRGRPPHVASALLMWVVLTLCAMIAYNFFPVTGPRYLFGSEHFAARLSNPQNLSLEPTRVGLYPRNGMPSMHFGWMLAATILCWRSGSRWRSRIILIVLTFLTAVATIYNGEHYVVDLIVAVPFVLACMALCSTSVPWRRSQRGWIVVLGFAAWLSWIGLLRFAIHDIVAHPWICWVMVGATALVVWRQGVGLARFETIVAVPDLCPAASDNFALAPLDRRIGVLFFISGFAALVYQVLFAKQLALVFGSTATATFTVLATFLGGMAIGSLIGGRLSVRLERPVLAYAAAELLIAVYCVLTPMLFAGIQQSYIALAWGHTPDSAALLALRVMLGAAVLLVPTVLMGLTLPLLAQVLGTAGERMGPKVAWLYFANTAGASLGALLTAYLIIPALGARSTTLIAAMLNLGVALTALKLGKQLPIRLDDAPQENPNSKISAVSLDLPRYSGLAAMLALGIGGILSLGLEVVYVHMLSIVTGNSVYAFGLMLATFLLGLSLGGEGIRRFMLRQQIDHALLLVAMLLGLALSVSLSAFVWNCIPEYFASFALYPAARSFGAREAIRGMICALIMIPPTLFIGAAYVVSMDISTAAAKDKPALRLGTSAALNTLGNIVGVLLFGFVLLPKLGGLKAGHAIAAAAVLLSLAVLLLSGRHVLKQGLAYIGAAALMTALSAMTRLDYNLLSSGANVYFSPQQWGDAIDHAESIDGGLTTVVSSGSADNTVKTLLTNGKFQGNDAMQGEMRAQIGFAMAPLLHQERRERALVIGYGTGVTSRLFHEAGFKRVEIAELSEDVVHLANKHFAKVNKNVSSSSEVRTHITDGRNLLLLSRNRYDVISIEITSIWFAGAASLYNEEFYRLVRTHLAPGGVLQQWVQLHHLSAIDILSIIATLRTEFRYISLYVIGGQGILVATNAVEHKNPHPQAIGLLKRSESFSEARTVFVKPVETLAENLVLDSEGIDRFLASFSAESGIWSSTDDNMLLEYSTPKGNVNDAKKSFETNMALLEKFRNLPELAQTGPGLSR